MTFGFLCLIQRPAPDFLAHIAAHAQAGDQVVLLNTSGDLQALTQLKQFAATTGWPAGVIVVEITTGTPAHLGLQCQLALSQVTTDKAIFLTDQIRLTQAFSAARHMATRADVVIGKGGSLGQIVFTPTDLPGWRANDDTLALTLMWHLSQQQVLQYPQALSTGHTGHDGTLFEALAQLITLYPQARSWVYKNLPDWIRCQMTGATLTMMPDAAKFICNLSDDTLQKIGFSTQQSLISALKAPAPATPAITGAATAAFFRRATCEPKPVKLSRPRTALARSFNNDTRPYDSRSGDLHPSTRPRKRDRAYCKFSRKLRLVLRRTLLGQPVFTGPFVRKHNSTNRGTRAGTDDSDQPPYKRGFPL